MCAGQSENACLIVITSARLDIVARLLENVVGSEMSNSGVQGNLSLVKERRVLGSRGFVLDETSTIIKAGKFFRIYQSTQARGNDTLVICPCCLLFRLATTRKDIRETHLSIVRASVG
jgi:hypothetical protein